MVVLVLRQCDTLKVVTSIGCVFVFEMRVSPRIHLVLVLFVDPGFPPCTILFVQRFGVFATAGAERGSSS